MKLKQVLLIIVISVLSAFLGMFLYGKYIRPTASLGMPGDGKFPANYASFFDNNGNAAEPTDFTKASESVIPTVVHIKTKIPAQKITNDLPTNRGRSADPFEDFWGDIFGFGPQVRPEQRASGSGVIISQDGYIVTNNHVVSDGRGGVAPEIKVTLNEGRKTYTAKVVGHDASTDIAVLKIDAANLPYIIYGNSDNIQLGQWVLAVGYPLTLEATVTAGIISAKGRSIGINGSQSESPLESFIQTDAAVNMGNSGGPLVDANGQLIGINSAILAPSGTYAGYSFAIPVNIVKKVVNDIIKYGDVKRGYIGINYFNEQVTPGENDRRLKIAGLDEGSGVYVMDAPTDGGAAKAGIKRGDIITKLNGSQVSSGIQMSGLLASAQPGDKVKITYIRGGKEFTTTVTLSGKPSQTKLTSADQLSDKLGVDLVNLSTGDAEKLHIKGGVKIVDIKPNGLLNKTRIEKSFIITTVNGIAIKNTDELAKALSSSRGSVVELEGIYPGYSGIYTYQINLNGDDDAYGDF